jgi:tetratricopeptide (TPR) repeat protein
LNLTGEKKPLSKAFLPLLLLVAVGVLVPVIMGNWLGDDYHLVVQAQCNHGLEQVADILLQTAGRCDYRPLRHISYAIDYSIWGLDPVGYHITNILFHLAAIVLVYLVFLRLGLAKIFAAFGAALFALHPVQVDAVGYIAGRRDVLMGFGYLVAFLGTVHFSYERQQKRSKPRLIAWAALIVLGAVISVASKEMGVTIAAVVVLFFLFGGDGVFSNSSSLEKSAWKHLCRHRWLISILAIPSVVIFVWRGILHPVSTTAQTLFGGTLARHIATILSVHARYVELLVFPWRLAGDYAPPIIAIPSELLSPLPVLGAVWLGLLVGLSVFFYRRGWFKESFGLAWYLITMLPVSHIIPHHELAAEHYLYIPIVGLALTTAALLQRLWLAHVRHRSTIGRRLFVFTVGIVLVALAARTFVRSFDYQSEIAHARATVRHFPASVRGRARLGLALLKEQGLEPARPHLEYVLGTSFQGSARIDVLRALGEFFVASGEYQKGTKLLAEYTGMRPGDRSPLEALSKAYFETGQLESAHQINIRLVKLAPDNAEYRYKAALTAWLGGAKETAHQQVAHSLRLDPEHLDALLLGATIIADRKPDKAADLVERADRVLRQKNDEPLDRQRRLLRTLREKLDYGQDELDH